MNAPAESRLRATLRLLLRLAIAGSLTGYLLWKADPRAVWTAVAGADWRFVGLAVLLTLLDRSLMAYRWVVLLCTVDQRQRPPLPAVLRVFFISTFVGTFLPSIGGDALRAYQIARLNVPVGSAAASVLLDRMFGVASILLMALAGLVLARDLMNNWAVVVSLAAAGALCAVTLLLIFSGRALAAATNLVGLVPAPKIRHGVGRLLESMRGYAAFPRELTNVLACSLAVQVVRVAQAYLLGLALGIAAPISVYFAFMPLILLIMLLPITFNGLGTSQAAFVWFFTRAGVAPAAAFTLSVLFVALGIVGNVPGALLYLWGNER